MTGTGRIARVAARLLQSIPLCLLAVLLLPSVGHATTTVTGLSNPEAPLEIDPGPTSGATTTSDLNFYTGDDVFQITDMPDTRTIDRVVLGPIGRDASCSGASVQLKIREIGGGVVATSTAYVSLPATPADMTFDVPATTLEAGHGYAFNLWHGLSSCVTGVRMTWPHNNTVVDGGTNLCADMPFHGVTYYRMWHVNGLSDEPICPSGRQPSNFELSMPTGWLAVQQVYPNWLVDAAHPFGLDPPQCDTTTGKQPRYWKQDPDNINYSYYACTFKQFANPGTRVTDGWYDATPWDPSSFNGAPRDMHLRLDPIDYAALADSTKPTYAFDEDENFYPQKASAFTDNWVAPDGGGYVDSTQYDNTLFDGQGRELAAAGSSGTSPFPPALSLGVLADHYGFDSSASTNGDYIDARGSDLTTYEQDSNSMRLLGDDNVVYDRVVYDPTDFKLWIQYWVFYYYNSFETLGLGLHEGDWEMVQIGFDSSQQPDAMTFAAHDGGYSCSWRSVEQSTGESPIVYIAAQSHASYPHAGSTDLEPIIATDHHRGTGVWSIEPIEDITDNTGWPTWLGRWGSSTSGDFQSPMTPSQQGDKWTDPSTFYNDHLGAGEC